MPGIEVDDITQGMTKYLLSIPEIVNLVGVFPTGHPAAGTPWIFQLHPQKIIEGTGSSAIVIAQRGGWTSPNDHNTANFPRMNVEIWVDALRDENNNLVEKAESRRRANYIHKVVDKHLHLPRGFSMMWGDVRVIASLRLTEFDIIYQADGDGLVVGSANYALSI